MVFTGNDRVANLSSYVPSVVVRQLAAAADPNAVPPPERFPAALALVDITGFTPITAAALARGPEGVEELSVAFNRYLGRIIDLTLDHGGDVAKFVGDALIPIWPAIDEDIASVGRRAVACGLAIAGELGEVEMEGGMRLSLKVGVCAGEVVTSHLGGPNGQRLFLLAGQGVDQLSDLQQHLQTGDVVATPDAWAAVSDRFVGQELRDGHVRVRRPDHIPATELPPAAHMTVDESALRAYVPRVLLSRIDAGQAGWLAELRRTTVAFVSVRGLEHGAPEALQLVHRLTEDAQHVLERYDGWLKEITMDEKGTTLIAVFGAPPFTHEDDAARAVDAALEIQNRITALGLGAGVGIATGPTFCGPVGNSRRRDFAMLGGHVNLAARLMQAAAAGGILCDAPTFEEAKSRHAFERLPAYVLKGLETPTDVYRTSAEPAMAASAATLVDRTQERRQAAEMLRDLVAGRGGLVTLQGEPGIGKSRIADEWVRQARELSANVLSGTATELQATTPYNAWRHIFERALGLAAVPDPAARRALVLERLTSDAQRRLAPLLGPALSIDIPDNEATAQLTGAVRADNTADLLIGLLRAEAAKGPLMLVLEDVHWLDSASWALVVRTRRELPEILLVLTRRPLADVEADPVREIGEWSTTIHLTALSRADALALAAQRTGASGLADPVARLVHERAQGNPLFIEQLTYALRDAGRIVVDHGMLRTASAGPDLAASLIPDSVQRVITTRLDQLPPAQALTIKVASVIGDRFAVRTLAEIYPVDRDQTELDRDLETLTRLDLVAPARSAPQPSYDFRHKATQEVAYNLMPRAQSEQLHRALAEWYERTYAGDLAPFHPFLAHHWLKAAVPERAVYHLELAATQALRTFANEEAIGFLTEAQALAADGRVDVPRPRRARWHLQLGEAHVNLSRYREGRDQLELGLRLLGSAGPAGERRLALAVVGQIVRQLGHRIGIARGSRRLSDAQRDDLVAVCRAYERLAEAAYYSGETLLPLYSAIRILNEAEASGSAPEIARGLAGTGALFGLIPMSGIAESYLGRALDRLGEVEDMTTHEIVGIVAAFHHLGAGRWQEARDELGAVRAIAHRLGDRRRLLDTLGNLAELEYLRGSFQAAAGLADEMLAHARARNDRRFEAEGLAVAAYAAWQLGRSAEALEAAAALNAMVSADAGLHAEMRIKHQGLNAMIQLGRGDRSAAVAASEEAMRLTATARPTYFATFLGYTAPAEVYLRLHEAGQPPSDAHVRAAQAIARLERYASVFRIGRPRYRTLAGTRAWLLGRHSEASRSWQRAVALAGELDMPYEQGLAHLEIARHAEPSDGERAAHVDAARDIFERLGAGRALDSLSEVAAAPEGPA